MRTGSCFASSAARVHFRRCCIPYAVLRRSANVRGGLARRPLPAACGTRGSGAMALSCNVREAGEVTQICAAAEAAVATILKPPHDVFWGGHIAYFEDPEGFVWEVAHNPFSPLGPNDEFQWNGA